ncbi:insulin gene enhancer protein isl-2b [Hoplias malabaricus]|uniref:insulin gene enhancer protein isl-2b n=1 Tax=Hoplias malabaricus TaxID=27720 RepID=UPI0034618DD8
MVELDIIFGSPFLDDMGDCAKKKTGLAMCVGCGSQIQDQYILRVSPDLEWHAACLKCAECSQYLDETCTCFVREGKTYCKRDYVRLFGIKCAKCARGFCSSDLVMRARDLVYHVECFRCSVCGRQLLPGDELRVRGDALLCREEHTTQSAAHIHKPVEPGCTRQQRCHTLRAAEKTTRVRTVLNEKQLHTLRTCYNANPRPDALMKEQLVEMTGLSPRVIRVWFQNKRCKDKKRSILMKQLQLHHRDTSRTALDVDSPLRHESTVMELHTFPHWKNLSEFTLNNDLEQPFQLVSFSESSSLGNSSGSDITSLSSQLPDTPSSTVSSPVET